MSGLYGCPMMLVSSQSHRRTKRGLRVPKKSSPASKQANETESSGSCSQWRTQRVKTRAHPPHPIHSRRERGSHVWDQTPLAPMARKGSLCRMEEIVGRPAWRTSVAVLTSDAKRGSGGHPAMSAAAMPPPQVVRSATPVTRANPRRHGGDVSGDGGAAGPSARGSCQRRRRRRGEGAVPSSDEREHPPPQRRRSRRRRKGRGAATSRQNWTIPVGDSSW